jgi:hypothetical protein
MDRCATCSLTAKYFFRSGARIVFACDAHAVPRPGKWKRVDALGGAVLVAQRDAARQVAQTGGR